MCNYGLGSRPLVSDAQEREVAHRWKDWFGPMADGRVELLRLTSKDGMFVDRKGSCEKSASFLITGLTNGLRQILGPAHLIRGPCLLSLRVRFRDGN